MGSASVAVVRAAGGARAAVTLYRAGARSKMASRPPSRDLRVDAQPITPDTVSAAGGVREALLPGSSPGGQRLTRACIVHAIACRAYPLTAHLLRPHPPEASSGMPFCSVEAEHTRWRRAAPARTGADENSWQSRPRHATLSEVQHLVDSPPRTTAADLSRVMLLLHASTIARNVGRDRVFAAVAMP